MVSAQKKWQSLGKPTHEQVEEQLSRILRSGELQVSRRGAALLTFVVEEAVAGRQEYLKAFTIATAVFDRDVSFDAQSDPCVRVEAARVRRALERYYLVYGIDDLVEITIPKGGYRPVFTLRVPSDAPSAEELAEPKTKAYTTWRERAVQAFGRAKRRRNVAFVIAAAIPASVIMLGILLQASTASQGHQAFGGKPAVIVGSFEGDGEGAVDVRGPAFVDEFRDQIIVQLASYSQLTVLIRQPNSANNGGPLYLLDGALKEDGSVLRVSARLVREADGGVVWAISDDHASITIRNAVDQSAERFAYRVADSLGKMAGQTRH